MPTSSLTKWLPAILRGSRKNRKARRAAPLGVVQLEDRITPAQFVYQAAAAQDARLEVVGGQIRLVDAQNPQQVLASQPVATTTDALIRATGNDVRLTIDASVPRLAGGVVFEGWGGSSVLAGPGYDASWHVTAPGGGDLVDSGFVRFSGVRTLVGAANTRDTFVVGPAGRLVGGVDGGAGGFDTLVFGGTYNSVRYVPTSPDAGTVVLDESVDIPFAGLEPVTSTVTSARVVVDFSRTDDTITLTTDPTDPNRLHLNANLAEDFSFLRPTQALVVNLGGADFTVGDVDLGNADLNVRSGEAVTVAGDVSAATIFVYALRSVTVADGASVTGHSLGRGAGLTGGDTLTFRSNTVIRPFGRTWADDGFAPGQVLTIAGTDSPDRNFDGKPDNDGEFLIIDVQGTTLTVDPGKPFTTQYQAAPSVFSGADGTVALVVNAGADLTAAALTPVVRERNASGTLTVGDAAISAANVLLVSHVVAQQIAEFEIDEAALADVPTAMPKGMAPESFPEFRDSGVDPNTGQVLPDTIFRHAGSWLAEGFVAGDFIEVRDSELNDGVYRLAAVDERTLILQPVYALRPEVGSTLVQVESVHVMTGDPPLDFVTDPATGRSLIRRADGSSWAADGFRRGQTITLSGSADGPDDDPVGDNDGEFPVMEVSGADLVVNLGNAVPGWSPGIDAIQLVPQTGRRGVLVTAQGSPGDIPLAVLDPNVALQDDVVALAFADNGAAPDTITRSTGSWAADGFAPGQTVLVRGTNFNDNGYEVAAVSADGRTLTLVAGAQLTAERAITGATTDVQALVSLADAEPPPDAAEAGSTVNHLVFTAADRTIRRRDTRAWQQDGFTVGLWIDVYGTTANNGTYRVTGISADGLALQVATSLADEDTQTTPTPEGVQVVTTLSLASPLLVFAGDTITRSSGSWADDWFAAGKRIAVEDSARNDGQFLVAEITNGGKTLRISFFGGRAFENEASRFVSVRGMTELKTSAGAPVTAGDVAASLAYTLFGPVLDLVQGLVAQATMQAATSRIAVGTGARISGTRDVTIRSVGESVVDAAVQSLWLGASYGKSVATSTVDVADGTRVTAGRNVAVAADVVNTMNAGVKIKTGFNPVYMAVQREIVGKTSLIPGPALAVAVGHAVSTSAARVGGPNSFIGGANVAVTADNRNDVVVASKAAIKGLAAPNTGGAAAVIVSTVSSDASVVVGGTVHATDDLTIRGRSVNLNNDADGRANVKREAMKQPSDAALKYANGAVTRVNAAVTSLTTRLKADLTPVQQAGKISGGAAVVFADSTNRATATVTSDARLFAGRDLTVRSDAEDNYKTIAIASAKANSTVALAGAVASGDYVNESRTDIADGAVLTAGRALTVVSESVIPNQIGFDEIFRAMINPPGIQPPPTVRLAGDDPNASSQAAQQATQDMLGWQQDNLVENLTYFSEAIRPLLKISKFIPNLLATTLVAAAAGENPKKPVLDANGGVTLDADGDVVKEDLEKTAFAVSGSVKLHEVTNRATARVGELAALNVFLTDTRPPTPFTVVAAADQSVTVHARTSLESIDLAGVTKPKKPNSADTKGESGIGGSFSSYAVRNEAFAHVEDGADVRAAGDVTVRADNHNLLVTVGQQGGKASKLGINGAVTLYRLDNVVRAVVEDQARISAGGDVRVRTENDVTAVNASAVIQLGGQVAVGVGVAVTDVSNTTQAFVGDLTPAVRPVPTAGAVTAGRDVAVTADNDTKLFSVGIAATQVKGESTETPPAPNPDGMDDTRRRLGLDLPGPTKQQPQFGIGVSANVAITHVGDDTRAYLQGTSGHRVDAGRDVAVTAESEDFVISATASIIAGDKAQTGATLAGSFTLNSLSGTRFGDTTGADRPRVVRAFVADTAVTARDVAVRAESDDFSLSVTAGVGVVKPDYLANIAGSVMIGIHDTLVEAYVGDRPEAPTAAPTSVTARGNVAVEAKSDLFALSVAGAVTISGQAAAGAAIDIGVNETQTRAFLGRDATVGAPTGNVTVASDLSQTAISVAAAVALLAEGLALPFSLTSQNYRTDATATVGENAVVVGRDVAVTAAEDLELTAVGGSLAFSNPSGRPPVGIGLAFALTDVDRDVEAAIRPGANVRATGPTGLKVEATGEESINTAAGSGAGGQQITTTVAPAVTELTGSVAATVTGAQVTASGVAVRAESDPNLFNLAVAGSVAVTAGGSPPPPPPGSALAEEAAGDEGQPYPVLPITFAGAGAGSGAKIRNRVAAEIIDSTVTATGAVTVTALDEATIHADAGGIAIAIRKGDQTSGGGVTASVGTSVAINDVVTDVTARVASSAITSLGDVNITADSRPKIRALTIAGAGGIGAGGGSGVAVGLAGAGSGSGNAVTNTVQALVVGSRVESDAGRVQLTATDASVIRADAGGFAVALSLGQRGAANVNLAVGAAAAVNEVRNTARAAVLPGAVPSVVTAAGDVTLTAASTSRIDALTMAGALGGTITGGGGVGVNFAGAGSGSGNSVANVIDARVEGGSVTSEAGQLAVTATDAATIHADAGAVAVAAAIATSGTVGVRGSVGASIGVNDIANVTTAVVSGATTRARRDVTVTATSAAAIDVGTLAAAGSIAAGNTGTIGASFAGAGAGSGNEIRNQTVAEVRNGSRVTSDTGTLALTAADTSRIDADALGAALAVSANTGANVAVAVGVAVAVNDIANTTRAGFLDSTLTGATGVGLTATEAADIDTTAIAATLAVAGGSIASVALGGGGAVTKNVIANATTATVADSTLTTSGPVALTSDDDSSITATVVAASVAAAFGPPTGVGGAVGFGAASNSVTNLARSRVEGSTVAAGGAVTLDANGDTTIDALTIGAAVGAGGGAAGVGVGAAGAGSGNTVRMTVEAVVADGSTITSCGGEVALTARDRTAIVADAGGMSLAAGVGSYTGVGASLGIAYAENDIRNTVRAVVERSSVDAAGAVALVADEAASIKALALSGAVAAGAAGVAGVGVAGSGAAAFNTVRSAVRAAADDGGGRTLRARDGGVRLAALDAANINASAGGVAAGVGAAAVGVGVTVGASILRNDVANTVLANVSGAEVVAAGDLELSATELTTVRALAVGGAITAAAGPLAGVAFSGAGADATNTIENRVEATARGATLRTTAPGADIRLTALDASNARAEAVAGAVAISASGLGGAASLAVGASLGTNVFRNTVRAFAENSTLVSADGITIAATEQATGGVLTVAASVAGAAGPVSAALAGGGATSTNRAENTIDAYTLDTTATAAGDLSIDAGATTTLDTDVGTAALALAGISASISVSTAATTDTTRVRAAVDGGSAAAGGNLRVGAAAGGALTSTGVATSISIGLAGAGVSSDITRTATVEAATANGATVSAGQDVTVAADATGSAGVNTLGAAGGLVAVGVSLASSTTRDNVSARTTGRTTGRRVRANGRAATSADAEARALSGGIIAGFGARADATNEPTVLTRTEGSIEATGDVAVGASAAPSADARALGGAFGGVTVGLSLARATAAPTVDTNLRGSTISTGGNVAATAAADIAENTALARSSGGAILVALSGAQADAISAPVVRATVGSGATVNAAQDVAVTATSTGTSTISRADGLTIGGLVAGSSNVANAAIGAGDLESIVDVSTRPARTLAEAGDQADVRAGRDLTLSASTSQGGHSTANAPVGGLVAIAGSRATTVRNVPTAATTGSRVRLAAGNDLTVSARNGYEPPLQFGNYLSATATNDAGGLVAAGSPEARTTVADHTTAAVGELSQVTAQAGSVAVRATAADSGVRSSATAKGGGLVAVVDADATTTLNNPARAAVGDGAALTGGTDVVVEANTGAELNADARGSGSGLGAVSDADATVVGTLRADAEVGRGAALSAGRELRVQAQETDRAMSFATATITGGAGIISSDADALNDTDHVTSVVVRPSARLQGGSLLRIGASVGVPVGASPLGPFLNANLADATSDAGGFAGSTNASAETDVFRSATTTVEQDEQPATRPALRTANLDVVAQANPALVAARPRREGFVLIDTGSSRKQEDTISLSNINFRADAVITGPATFVRIDPTGRVTTSGARVDTQPGRHAVAPISAAGGGQATLRADGGVIPLIVGDGTFTFDSGGGGITVINQDTTRDLIVDDVIVTGGTGTPRLTVSPQFGTFAATTNSADAGGTPVVLTSARDVVLTGVIDNARGPVAVTAAGAIRSGAARQRIVSPGATLTAASVGAADARVNARLVPAAGPSLTTATTGDQYLNLSAADAASVSGSLSGRTVDANMEDGAAAYALAVAASELNATAGLLTPVNLSVTSAGDLNVGAVASRRGDVSLTAAGAIRATRPGGAVDVAGRNLSFTANSAGPLVIDSTGTVAAAVAQNLTLVEAAGDLSLNLVRSAGGTITLSAAGRVLDGRTTGGPAVNLDTPGRAVLTAQGIGGATGLVTKLGELQADAGAGDLFVREADDVTVTGAFGLLGRQITVTANGKLVVAKDVAATGPVSFTAGGAVEVRAGVRSPNNILLRAATITVFDGATVQSFGPALVDLSATGNVHVREGARVASDPRFGTVTLQSTGNANNSLVEVHGTLVAETGLVRTGSGTFDVITLRQPPQVGTLTATAGGGFADLLVIGGTAGNDTYHITGDQVQFAGGSTIRTPDAFDLLFIDSGTGTDTFNVTGTSARTETRLTTGEGSTLNLSTNGRLNAPLVLNPLRVGVPATVNITAAYQTAAPYPNDLLVESSRAVGLGLNATFGGTGVVTVALTGQATDLTLGAPSVPTTVTAGAAPHTITVGTGDLAAFSRLLTVTATAGSGTSLRIDNGEGLNPAATLTADTAAGLGGAGVVRFTGVDALTVDAGNGTLTVLGTITGPVAVNTGFRPEDPLAPDNTVRVVGSAASRLAIRSTGAADAVVFDASARTAPLSATLADGAAGTTELTGFGAVGPVTFAGFARAELLGGAGSDAFTLNASTPTLAVTVSGGGGDDAFTVLRAAVPADPLRTPHSLTVSGDAGADTVTVVIPGDPSAASNRGLTYLKPRAERLVVDNTGNPAAVAWVSASGAVLGPAGTQLLDISGADAVDVRGGTAAGNTLRVEAGGLAQNATIDGDKVTLRTNGLLQFARLTAPVASYTEGNFTIRSVRGLASIAPDTRIQPAITQLGEDAWEFVAADGGVFNLYSLDVVGDGVVFLVGTTATGETVSQQLGAVNPAAFRTVVMDPAFRNLTRVTVSSSGVSLTNFVALETYRPGTPARIEGVSAPAGPGNGVAVSTSFANYLTARDGGTFAVRSAVLDTGPTPHLRFVGTTATGGTVVQEVLTNYDDTPLAFGPQFVNLVALSFEVVSGGGFNIRDIVTTYTPGAIGPVAQAPGAMPGQPQTVVLSATGVALNGQTLPTVVQFTGGVATRGVFNGTPYTLTPDGSLVFHGDLNIPAGSTVTFAGGAAPLTVVVEGDLNVGPGTTVIAPPGSVGGGIAAAAGAAGATVDQGIYGRGLGLPPYEIGARETVPGNAGGAGGTGGAGGSGANAPGTGGAGAGGGGGGAGGAAIGGGETQAQSGASGAAGGSATNGTFIPSATLLVGGGAGGSGGGGGAGGNGGGGTNEFSQTAPRGRHLNYGQIGGVGGTGGAGGAGGGAFALRITGRAVLVGVTLRAAGADGQAGAAGSDPGSPRFYQLTEGAINGSVDGPYLGGNGGDGATGSAGGHGGGGAGGTIRITAAAFTADATTVIDTRGGLHGDGTTRADNGQFQFASAAGVRPAVTLLGVDSVFNLGGAPTGTNARLRVPDAAYTLQIVDTGIRGAPGFPFGLPASGQNLVVVGLSSNANYGAHVRVFDFDGVRIFDDAIDPRGVMDYLRARGILDASNALLPGTVGSLTAAQQLDVVGLARTAAGTAALVPLTPTVAGLAGGPNEAGVVADPALVAALNLGGLLPAAPAGAVAAVTRVAIPAGFDQYAGYDLAVFANLTSVPLSLPKLGLTLVVADTAFVPNLRAEQVGAAGLADARNLGAIPGGGVFVTLVPKSLPAGSVFVNASLGGGVNGALTAARFDAGDTYYFTLPAVPAPAPAEVRTYTVTFSNMAALTVAGSGGADSVFNQVATPSVATFTLDLTASSGDTTVNLLDAGTTGTGRTTVVRTGSGDDRVVVQAAQTGRAYTVETAAGSDTLVVGADPARPAASLTADLGAGDDVALFRATDLDSSVAVALDGGADTDTLLYDAAGSPIAPAAPAIPAGSITLLAGGVAAVNYQRIESVPGFAGPTADVGGPYAVAQGQPLALRGAATAATNTLVVSIGWDLNGDGVFTDATDPAASVGAVGASNPVVPWERLRELGLGRAGTSVVGMRVTSTAGASYAYTTLTVAKAAPTVTVTAPAGLFVARPVTVSFAADFPGGETASEFVVDWGDGSTVTLPGSARAATHTYTSTGSRTVRVSVVEGGVTTPSAPQTVDVTVDPSSVRFDGPYAIDAGGGLTVRVTADGAPLTARLDFGAGTFTAATAFAPNGDGTATATLALTWAQLQAAGVSLAGGYPAVRARVEYAGETLTSTTTALTVNPVAPTAAFAGTAVEGGPGRVSFTGAAHPSDPEAAAGFLYSFDVGNTGTFQVIDSTSPDFDLPADVVARAGSVVVRGRVATRSGQSAEYLATVPVVNQAPAFVTVPADATATARVPFALAGVSFRDPGLDVVSAEINWGDGSTTAGVVVVTSDPAAAPTTGTVSGAHTFAPRPAPYDVTVTLRDAAGAATAVTFRVTVLDATLTDVSAGPDVTTGEGSRVSLAGSFVDAAAPSGYAVTIDWGDGTVTTDPAVTAPATPADLGRVFGDHHYGRAGTYTATMTVTKAGQLPVSSSFTATVANVAPVVTVEPVGPAGVGVPVVLRAAFTDAGFGGAGTYTATIDWGDGTTGPGLVAVTPGGPGVPTTGTVVGTHQYAGNGPYTITVMVDDGAASVVVTNAAPAVTAAGGVAAAEGERVTVRADFRDPGFDFGGTVKTFTATIDWGDGTVSDGVVTVTPGAPTTGTVTGEHVYGRFGRFPVVIRVADEGGAAGEAALETVIANQAPTVAALPVQVFTPGQEFLLDGTFADAGFGNVHTVTISWGDGSTSTFDANSVAVGPAGEPLALVTAPTAGAPGGYRMGHVYAAAGDYPVTVTVGDDGGLSATASRTFGARPTVTGIATTTPAGLYPAGTRIEITVTFSRPVTLTGGTLTIPLDSGGTVTIAPFAGATATGVYTVTAGQTSGDLRVGPALLLSPGATLVDDLGAAVDLTAPTGALTSGGALAIDAVRPTLTVVTPTAAAGRVPFEVRFVFDKPVSGFGPAAVAVVNGALGNLRALDGSTYTAQVTPAAAGDVTVSVSDGAGTDAAGNPSAAAAGVVARRLDLSRAYAVAGADVQRRTAGGPAGASFNPFGTGVPVRAVVADVTGDGVEDTVVGTGPGRPSRVAVIDGATGKVVFAAAPFEPSFAGGVYLAAGDVNGDGKADIAVGADLGGGPRVLVYDGATGAVRADFLGIDDAKFRGGARVALGDVNGDGRADLMVAAGVGGGPRVAVWDGASLTATSPPTRLVADFFAYEETLRDGAYVAAGDVDGDGHADLILSGGPLGGPRVTVWSGAALAAAGPASPVVLADYFAADPKLRTGARVAAKDLDGDGRADLVTAVPLDADTTRVRRYSGDALATSGEPAAAEEFEIDLGGVYVG